MKKVSMIHLALATLVTRAIVSVPSLEVRPLSVLSSIMSSFVIEHEVENAPMRTNATTSFQNFLNNGPWPAAKVSDGFRQPSNNNKKEMQPQGRTNNIQAKEQKPNNAEEEPDFQAILDVVQQYKEGFLTEKELVAATEALGVVSLKIEDKEKIKAKAKIGA